MQIRASRPPQSKNPSNATPASPSERSSSKKELELAVKEKDRGDSLSPALSPIECRDLANACLTNTRRLISSSRVLLQADDAAGSLGLLAAATHEMGRAVLVAFSVTTAPTPASWRRFWFNFRSPRAGVRALLNWEQMAAQGPDFRYSHALARLAGMEGVHQRLSKMVNYTSFSSSGPGLPEKLLSRVILDDAQAVTRARFLIASAGLPMLFSILKPEYSDLLTVCRAAHTAYWEGEGQDIVEHVGRLCSYIESAASSIGSEPGGIA